MMLCDFHIHSTFSDGKLTIPEVVDLFGKNGFGAIAITDHYCDNNTVLGKAAAYLNCTLTASTFPIYMEILRTEAERAWDQYKMILIAGVEITKNSLSNSRSAHLLGLGISEAVSADPDVIDIARSLKAQGALVAAAHPVWTRKNEKQTYHLWDRREELRSEIDAWEVASGQALFPEVWESKLPRIANSDLHHPDQMTSWKTVIDGERHPMAILEAIKKQKIGFHYFQNKKSREVASINPLAISSRLD